MLRCGRKCDVEVLRHVQFVEQVPKNAFSKKVSVGRRAQRRQTPEEMAACTRLFVRQLTAGGVTLGALALGWVPDVIPLAANRGARQQLARIVHPRLLATMPLPAPMIQSVELEASTSPKGSAPGER